MTLLIDEITSSSLQCSLYGTKRMFERQLKLRDMLYIFTNNHKAPLLRKKEIEYPYAYFAMNSMRISKDDINVKALRRSGINHRSNGFNPVGGLTNATTQSYYMFPAKVSCDLHYFDSDIKRIIKFIEVMLILGVTDCFNFNVRLDNSAQWMTRIELTDDTITIPEYDLESPENPGASEIVIPFIIHTHIGFARDTAKVNSDRPTITFAMNTDQETSETVPD